MKKFMTRKHTEEHLSNREERFSDLMGKGLFLLAFSSALSTNIWAQTTTTTNAQTTSQNFTGKVCDSKDGSSLIGCTVRVKGNIIRKSKFPPNPERSVQFSGKRTKRSVQKIGCTQHL